MIHNSNLYSVYRKHRNELQKLIKGNKIDKDCKICPYFATDYNDWEVHVTCESHVTNYKLKSHASVEIPPPLIVPPPATQSSMINIPLVQQLQIPPLMPSSNPPEISQPKPVPPPPTIDEKEKKLNEKALIQILSKNKKEWKCSSCNVVCQSACSWKAHLASKKHQKNSHKFRTYPGISKEVVHKKYQNSFVRANEAIGNEFIEDGVIFYCKRCNVRMSTKAQLEVHMNSNLHKQNYPAQATPTDYEERPRFENSAYGYAGRSWMHEQQFIMQSAAERQKQMEQEYEKQLLEKAKNDLLARFPYYALNKQHEQQANACSMNPENIPMPVESPSAESIPLINYNDYNFQ